MPSSEPVLGRGGGNGAAEPDLQCLSVSLVWLPPPWPISSHHNIIQHGAGKTRTQEQQAGNCPRAVPVGSLDWGHPSVPVTPSVNALEPPAQPEPSSGPA